MTTTTTLPTNGHNGTTQHSVDDPVEQPTLQARVQALDVGVRAFVVERPVLALCGAIAGGFLIGRLLSR